MHFRFVTRQLGMLLFVLSASMVFSGLMSILCQAEGVGTLRSVASQDAGLLPLLWSIAAGVVGGLLLVLLGRGGASTLGRREALLLVSATWFIGGLLSALPFWLWAQAAAQSEWQSFVNCYFEAISGLTTTGATVLTDIPVVPKSLLFWRAFTHWLGGLGIVVLFVAVLPHLGVGGKRLFRIETTGVGGEGVTPRIVETAQVLWLIYLGLTILQTLLLKGVGGMSWFDALTHTFATLATGGFSTVNASAGDYLPAAQWIIVAFMLLAGVNFALYHQAIRQRSLRILQDTELRAYVLILLCATLAVALSINGKHYPGTDGREFVHSGGDVVRDAAFQVVSIQTTTGFCSADFNLWPLFAKAVLVALMYVGGCGGSTGGGIKVIRILVAVKVMWAELERAFRPKVVRTVRVGTVVLDDRQRLAILAYVLGIVVLTVLGTGLLVLCEGGSSIDEVTAVTAVIACVNNIGPGLGGVGAVENYAWFSDTSKLLLCLLMAVGRLEVFPVLVIFMPRFWRSV